LLGGHIFQIVAVIQGLKSCAGWQYAVRQLVCLQIDGEKFEKAKILEGGTTRTKQ
jgi:hypothetical protein